MYAYTLTYRCICIMYACRTQIWVWLPICVTDSCAAPAGDVPLSPSLLLSFYQGHLTVQSQRSQASSQQNRAHINTAEHIHIPLHSQHTKGCKLSLMERYKRYVRYSMSLQSRILLKIKGRGSWRRHLSPHSSVWLSGYSHDSQVLVEKPHWRIGSPQQHAGLASLEMAFKKPTSERDARLKWGTENSVARQPTFSKA